MNIKVKLSKNMKEYVEKIREKALSENRTEYETALENYRKYLKGMFIRKERCK